MNKARKLGPQSLQDFLSDQLPLNHNLSTNHRTNYTTPKGFTAVRHSADESKDAIVKLQTLKEQQAQRYYTNVARRQTLQLKSKQKFKAQNIEIENPEQLIQNYSPVHLFNGIDNEWNHMEKLDRKHLNFLYGPKTFMRQKKAISMIEENYQADLEVEIMRQNCISKSATHKSKSSKETSIVDFKIPAISLYNRPEFKNFLLTTANPQDRYGSRVLYKHYKQHINKDFLPKKRAQSTQIQNETICSEPYQQNPNLDVSREIAIFEKKLKSFK